MPHLSTENPPQRLVQPAAPPLWAWEFFLLLQDMTPQAASEGCSAVIVRQDENGDLQQYGGEMKIFACVRPGVADYFPAGTIVKADWHGPTGRWWLSGTWMVGM